MKERPILFSGPMVRAILEGRKTQTRRVIKPTVPEGAELDRTKFYLGPYGVPGDRLWVRESVCLDWGDKPVYKADDPTGRAAREAGYSKEPKYKPSIHMPRWASRITLEITDVRVERLREITYKDAQAEGCNPPEVRMMTLFGADAEKTKQIYSIHAEIGFRPLWDAINAKRGFGWNTNPWVWALTFKKI